MQLKHVLPLALLVAAAPAFASDGALEINAACIAAGCFPGDTAGLPVQTQVGKHYVLTSDLTVGANQSAISLAAAATLDLGGFAITGPVTCSGSPAVCVGAGTGTGVTLGRGATVRNGSIRGMSGTGISMTDLSVADDVLVEQNGLNGISGSADGAIVRGCRIADNGSSGIQFALGAGSPGALILDSVIFRNGGEGVAAAEVLVRNDTVIENGGLGLHISFVSSDSGFVGNVIRNNNGGNANPQTQGGNELGLNVCGTDTTCP